jgi:hypothetical protein
VDPETGVASWDYRIRAADGTVIRDWPSEPDRTTLRNGGAITTEPLPLADGQEVYAEIRTRNAQGRTSITASGPLTVDLSPPPPPTLTLAFGQVVGGDASITMEYRTPVDDTGLVTHEWVLLDPNQGGVVARGIVAGTGGLLRTRTFLATAASGDTGTSITPGNYLLSLFSRSGTGLVSNDATVQVTVQ